MMRRHPCFLAAALLVGLGLFIGFSLRVGAEQATSTQPALGAGSPSPTGKIFNNGLPPGYTLRQEGRLRPSEGLGSYLVLGQSAHKVTAVIVDVEEVGWLRTQQLKSTNPVVVARHMLARFFQQEQPTTVQEVKTEDSSQFASHLLIKDREGVTRPAITLRLLYPGGRAVIMLLRHDVPVAGLSVDASESYKMQERLAQRLMAEVRVAPRAESMILSERLMLRGFRHIFRDGVFTHRVK